MFNEQKVLHDFEHELCRRAVPFLLDVGAVELHQIVREGYSADLPHEWRLRNTYKAKRRTNVIFRGFVYAESRTDYGPVDIIEEPSQDGNIREHIQAPPEGLKRKIERTVKSEERKYTDYSHGASFSVTHVDKASASGGVKGIAKADASTETTTHISAQFGRSGGQATSRETTLKGITELKVPGDAKRILTADISRIKEIRPFTETAYLDPEIDFDLYDWAGTVNRRIAHKQRDSNVVHNENIQDILWLIEGQRMAEYPGMQNFLNECSDGSRAFYEWLKNKENRRVDLQGQQIRHYPAGLNINVRPV